MHDYFIVLEKDDTNVEYKTWLSDIYSIKLKFRK